MIFLTFKLSLKTRQIQTWTCGSKFFGFYYKMGKTSGVTKGAKGGRARKVKAEKKVGPKRGKSAYIFYS
jgi:hypothetical protein